MIAIIPAATLSGTAGKPVSVEVHVSGGLPGFTVVGLPDAEVRESRDRVRAAVLSSGLPWPQTRITVNLAPSGLRKAGAGLDLPIAVGVLGAQGVLPPPDASQGDGGAGTAGVALIGELGLDGSLRHVPGMVALAAAAGGRRLVVPAADVAEAALVRPGEVAGVASLREVVDLLRGRQPWPAPPPPSVPGVGGDGRCSGDGTLDAGAYIGPTGQADGQADGEADGAPDLADVRGQRVGRRALEVAAAGGHHLLMVGPPGSGKTMLARRLPGILPPLDAGEALEVVRIRSAAGLPLGPGGPSRRPPFRAPHHGASAVSLVGGGTRAMRPGEISLADHGVLFLDEMGEFPAAVLDALRQPLEEGVVRVSRARASVRFPARFLLVGAMNPCPCGEGVASGSCRCLPAARARYARRLSGPLLDRFDLVVPLDRPDPHELLSDSPSELSGAVAARVARARALARSRGVGANAGLPAGRLDRDAPLTPAARAVLEDRLQSGALSARGLHRVRRVARTVADLAGEAGPVGEEHVAEALALRAGRDSLVPPVRP